MPKVNQRGIVLPLLPIIGMIVLTVGIAIAISLLQRNSQGLQSQAGEPTAKPTTIESQFPLATPDSTEKPASGSPKKFSDLLN